jgi:GTP cyclohydrolase I
MKQRAPVEYYKAAAAVTQLLYALGFDTTDPAIVDTPKRVAKAWEEMLSGYQVDTMALLKTDFGVNYDEMIVLRGVPFYSTCEHHLLPFSGTAGVAYIPNGGGRVVGLSKLARLVEAHARRLQIQERMTADIASDLQEALKPAGVAVIVQASHSCMCARGVQKPGSEMVTSRLLGAFKDKPEARAEVLALLREGPR